MSASYLMGFPWADNEDSAVAVYVVTGNDQELADKIALNLADLIWSKRNEFEFLTEAYHQEEALDKAFEGIGEGKAPIYIPDSGDNPTTGTSSSVNLDI